MALYEAITGIAVYPALKEWILGLLEPSAQPASPLPGPASPLAEPESPLQPQVEGGRGRHTIRLGACPPLEMVHIPAGWFLMGTDKAHFPEARGNESPPHQVYLGAYAISRTPVTVAQFGVFVAATGFRTAAEEKNDAYTWRRPRGGDSDVHQKQDHPVTQVSWHDAQAFCQWARVRLPTEAEWEKAARGTDGRIYPWGNEPPDKERCNIAGNVGDTTPVGSYPRGASPYGLHDMAGNVWEWTADWYGRDYYAHSPKDNPKGPATGEYRTVRGGSWYDGHRSAAAVGRYYDLLPGLRNYFVGFRVVCSVPVISL